MPLSKIPSAGFQDNVKFRNLIINGSMDIAQRGTSFTGITATQTYTLDRWFGRSLSSSSMSVSQSTDAPDKFLYSAKCQKPSGQSASIMRFEQPFETNNIVYLRGQKVTVSFYAKKGADYSPTDDAFPIALYSGNGTERARNITAFDNEALNINTSVTLTSTWQKFSVTSSTLPSDLSQLALQFQPTTTVTAGADESFFITGVQLEAGTTASEFEFVPYDITFERCQRYFQQWVMGTSNEIKIPGFCRNTTTGNYPLQFKSIMRSAPTASSEFSSGKIRHAYSNDTNTTSFTANSTSVSDAMLTYGASSPTLTTGQGSALRFFSGGNIKMDAEL